MNTKARQATKAERKKIMNQSLLALIDRQRVVFHVAFDADWRGFAEWHIDAILAFRCEATHELIEPNLDNLRRTAFSRADNFFSHKAFFFIIPRRTRERQTQSWEFFAAFSFSFIHSGLRVVANRGSIPLHKGNCGFLLFPLESSFAFKEPEKKGNKSETEKNFAAASRLDLLCAIWKIGARLRCCCKQSFIIWSVNGRSTKEARFELFCFRDGDLLQSMLVDWLRQLGSVLDERSSITLTLDCNLCVFHSTSFSYISPVSFLSCAIGEAWSLLCLPVIRIAFSLFFRRCSLM